MRRIRKTFKRPKKAWDLSRIKEEKIIVSRYGLRRKRELWKAEEILRNFRRRARNLIAAQDKEKEKVLIDKLISMGLLSNVKGAGLDDVLALSVNDVLERRLQTVLFKKGKSDSVSHARQMIVHGHVSIDGKRMKFPSYMVPKEKEHKITVSKKAGSGK